MDIREHLQADLLAHSTIDRVAGGYRPQGTPVPALVWRCTHGDDGEDLQADNGLRSYHFEIVIWAKSISDCVGFKRVLLGRYHGTEGYEFGGRAPETDGPDDEGEAPLVIDSSRKLDEYDGDRVMDTYDDNGAVALTLVVEFMWTE